MNAAVDIPLSDLAAVAWTRPAGAWRLRLIFVGANPDNVSGESRKYWQITGRGNEQAEIRWGRLGSKGQTQHAGPGEAVDRARDKIRKGYVVDSDSAERVAAIAFAKERQERAAELQRAEWLASRPPVAAPRRTLAEALPATAFKALGSEDETISTAAVLGWVSLDLDETVEGYRLFVGKGDRVWALRLSPLGYGQIDLGRAS